MPAEASQPAVWRIHDRLGERDIVWLILAFRIGAPKYEMAKRYRIGMKSVKKLLRKAGVKPEVEV